jgi:FkbM family methyltransferase
MDNGKGAHLPNTQGSTPGSLMSFISYAQNQEDVMLYRALRDVKHGFYIDVGAQDPVSDSVTKVFYDRGWHGINIEPSQEYFLKLENERPHDLNLATAVGREPGVIGFYEVAQTGLSTTKAGYAQRYSEDGYQVERREVRCTTLDRICADNGVATIHFLKIDVEGAEREVLEGFSFETVRPWLVVVEATEPDSDREIFAEWEDLLLGRRYRFVYFDGLNRFYAAEEHADLVRHFSRPPNLFDQYITYRLWRTRADLKDAQAAARNALVNSLNHMLAEVQNARAEAQSLREAIAKREQSLQEAVADRERQLSSLQEAVAEHHRQLSSLREAVLAEHRGQLANLQEAVAEREQQLDTLHAAVAERDQQISSQHEQISSQHEQISSQHEQISSQHEQISWLHEVVAERDRWLATVQTNLAKSQRRLQSVRSSISWKITSPLRETRRAAVRIIGLFRRPSPPSPIATTILASSDLAVPREVAAALTEPARLVYCKLRDAADFQQRTAEKKMLEEQQDFVPGGNPR